MSGVVRGFDRLPAPARLAAGPALVGVVVVAQRFLSPYWVDVLALVAVYALLATGLNVVVGLAGLLDLGYVAFWAIGSYTMGVLSGAGPVDAAHLSVWVILPLGLVAASIAGVLLGAPVLRLRGDYLAIVTLGFGEIIRIVAANLDDVTGGARGIHGIPSPVAFGYAFKVNPRPYLVTLAALLCVMLFVIRRLNDSRVGRAWVAIREDEVAAEAMGIPTTRMKLWAFAIGASTSGLAGVIQTSKSGFVSPESFSILISITILSAVVLGGMGSLTGSLVGAAIIVGLPEVLRFMPERLLEARSGVFGALLVAMMVFRPQGIVPSRRRSAELHGVGVADVEKTGVEVEGETG